MTLGHTWVLHCSLVRYAACAQPSTITIINAGRVRWSHGQPAFADCTAEQDILWQLTGPKASSGQSLCARTKWPMAAAAWDEVFNKPAADVQFVCKGTQEARGSAGCRNARQRGL